MKEFQSTFYVKHPWQSFSSTWNNLREKCRKKHCPKQKQWNEKSNYKTRCSRNVQKIEAAGILCGDRPWKFCDSKADSLTYPTQFMHRNPMELWFSRTNCSNWSNFQKIELWVSLDDVFTKQRKINFARYTFLTREQLRAEPIEKYYGCLLDLSRNCDLDSQKELIIRDVFLSNMQDGEIQCKISMKRKTQKALDLAINVETDIKKTTQIIKDDGLYSI